MLRNYGTEDSSSVHGPSVHEFVEILKLVKYAYNVEYDFTTAF